MTALGARLARAALVIFVAILAIVAGWFVLLSYPESLTDLFGVLLLVGFVLVAVRFSGNVASSLFPSYNVAEVEVDGPITRDGRGNLTSPPTGAVADDVVEQIERADEDRGVSALLVKLNTPGGEIVPSEDIRLAAERFDGPTVAYTTDVCASGGYDIAAGCDELWAREGSIVGSIGVIGSRVNAAGLAEKIGLDYEQLTAGAYKDAGTPLKELESDERAYLQGLIDDYYDQFVTTVAEGRDLDEAAIRDTEAKIYLGEAAAEIGLVDAIGTREDVEERVEELLNEPVTVEEFSPARGIARRLRRGAQSVAFSLGAGFGTVVSGDVGGFSVRR